MINPEKARARMKLAAICQRAGLSGPKLLRAIDYPDLRGMTINATATGLDCVLQFAGPRSGLRRDRLFRCRGVPAVSRINIGDTSYRSARAPFALNVRSGVVIPAMAQVTLNGRSAAATVTIEPSGTDLDTRTSIVNSGSAQDGIEVGWSRESFTSYLTWGGDNTDPVGNEYVDVDLAAIRDVLGLSSVDIRCAAFWYASKGTGIINLSVTNAGTQNSSQNYVVSETRDEDGIDGEEIEIFTFDTSGGETIRIVYAWDSASISQGVLGEEFKFPLQPPAPWSPPPWISSREQSDNVSTPTSGQS